MRPVPREAGGAIRMASERPAVAMMLALTTSVGVATAALASSPAPRGVEPYGPAANGSLVTDAGGDIHIANADGSDDRVIVPGPALDVAPWFSRDGRHIAYLHDPEGVETLVVMDSDGTDPRTVVAHPWWVDFMPDGTSMAGTYVVDGQRKLGVFDLDSGAVLDLPLGDIVPTDWSPVIARPPVGEELIFTAWPHAGSSDKGIYAVRLDGSMPRRIGGLATGETDDESDGTRSASGESLSFQDMVVSPDGSRVAYWSWEPDPRRRNAPGPTVHVRDLDSGSDTTDIQSGEPGHGVLPEFSPDGARIVFEGHTAVGSAERLFSQPSDGSSPAVPFGPAYPYEDRQGFDILPDGRSVAYTTRDGEITVIDIATGDATVLPVRMSATDTPSWQRVAP